ncbi:MAG TPA: hypothetical protein VK966_09325 [Longimicrobiales bacterium]|nr:hypothetical protein [Longimicrobiales bacterium]
MSISGEERRRPGSVRERARGGAAVLLLGLLGGLACEPTEARTPRLAGGTATLESLGQEVWAALVAADTGTLNRLRLDRGEHDGHVWPEQPAARSASAGDHLDLWWRNIETRNDAAVAELTRRFRGSEATLVETRCGEEPLRYETYEALTDCRLVLEAPDGTRTGVEAFRHVVRMDGVYKVVRYYGE